MLFTTTFFFSKLIFPWVWLLDLGLYSQRSMVFNTIFAFFFSNPNELREIAKTP